MKKILVTGNLQVTALAQAAGTFGTLIAKQDDEGGHVITLATGNTGTVMLNTLPRAITQLDWIRTDEGAYWIAKVLDTGITPTTVPVIRIEDYNDTLEVFHSLPNTEILMSVNDGPYLSNYFGRFNIGPVDRPAGYWKFKIRESVGRLESKVASSLPTHSIKAGFNFILNFALSS